MNRFVVSSSTNKRPICVRRVMGASHECPGHEHKRTQQKTQEYPSQSSTFPEEIVRGVDAEASEAVQRDSSVSQQLEDVKVLRHVVHNRRACIALSIEFGEAASKWNHREDDVLKFMLFYHFVPLVTPQNMRN